MKLRILLRTSFAVTVVLLLSACEKDENERILDQIERARTAPMVRQPPPLRTEGPAFLRPEDRLSQISEGQSLILLCAGDLRDPVQAAQLRILESAVPALGRGLVLKHLDAAGEAAMQLRQLQAAARVKPPVLILHALETTLTPAVVQDMRAAGTVVLSTDGGLPQEAWDQAAWVDQRKVGAAAGDAILAALRRKAEAEGRSEVTGRIAQITLFEETTTTKARTEGLLSILQEAPGVILVHDAPGEGTKEGAELRLQEALRLQGHFDSLLVHSDTMAAAISEALSAAGLRESTLIVSIGGLRERNSGVELLRRGEIDVLIAHPLPMEKLYLALQRLASEPGHKPAVMREELPPLTLTPKNVNDIAP